MTEKFKNITQEKDELLFNPKKINLPYTICIIKPAICLSQESCQQIIDLLEQNNFEIRYVIQRELSVQECENLYYKHEGKVYFNELVVVNSTGESMVMLLANEKFDPIEKMKELMGDKNPEKAREEDAECLRAKFGKDLIRNGIYRYKKFFCFSFKNFFFEIFQREL